MKIFVLERDELVMSAIDRHALAAHYPVRPIVSLHLVENRELASHDILLISRAKLSDVLRRQPSTFKRASRRIAVVVAQCQDQIFSSLALLDHADGWVFLDCEPGVLLAALKLVGQSHCIMPDRQVGAVDAPYVAVAAIPTLSQIECAYLMELGRGHGTNLIARRLGLPKTRAKRVGDRLLAKLGVAGPIDAGAFARRYQAEVAHHRSKSFRLENLA